MTNIEEITEEIETFGEMYKNSDSEIAKKSYDQYITLIIQEADKSEQYRLCDYWEKVRR